MLDAMTRGRLLPIAALAIALVLAGCSAQPPSGGTSGNGGSGGTSGGSGVAEGDAGTGDGADGTPDDDLEAVEGRLPPGWPQDVVVAEGEIVQGVSMGGAGWLALVNVADTEAAFAASSSSLQSAGYAVVSEAVTDSGSIGIYENDEFQVQVAVTDAPGAGWTMSYTITTKG
jgi:hypothetical protein